jgi:hypothetical protein
VAVVGADGTAASFETLRRFRRLLATVAVAGAVAGGEEELLASADRAMYDAKLRHRL